MIINAHMIMSVFVLKYKLHFNILRKYVIIKIMELIRLYGR